MDLKGRLERVERSLVKTPTQPLDSEELTILKLSLVLKGCAPEWIMGGLRAILGDELWREISAARATYEEKTQGNCE